MRTIFTIGYEGTDIDRFVMTLTMAGVAVLADVRAVTVSRKRGFSKNELRARLAQAGIKYVHFRGLGDPKPGREAARAGHYDTFREIYSSHLATPEAQNNLMDLAKVVADGSTCLMCYERDPAICHRSIVAKSLSIASISIRDLYVDTPRLDNYASRGTSCSTH